MRIARVREGLTTGGGKLVVGVERSHQEVCCIGRTIVSQRLSIGISSVDTRVVTSPVTQLRCGGTPKKLICILLSLVRLVVVEVEARSKGIGRLSGEVEATNIVLVDVVLLQKRDGLLQILIDLLVGLLEGPTGIVGQDRRDTLCDIGDPEVRRTTLTIEVVGEAEDVRQLEVRPSTHGEGFSS